MNTLVCHRCGFTTPHDHDDQRVQCPADGLFLVAEDEHRRAPRDTYLGTVLGGRYPILGLVGQGGMGAVYRSVQPLVDRPVAVKVIHPRLTIGENDPTAPADDVAARFLREGRLIAALSHPNVVTMYDFGTESDGTLFMVQELLTGDSLRRALPLLAPRALVALCVQLLGALEAAHKLGLVHRDVKPENVMLAEGWQPDSVRNRLKLLDFGIARRVGAEDSGRLTTQGAIFGTPAYMAPEQAQGSDHVDARADLYSVGVLLYEGLAGRPPFGGTNALAVVVAVLAGMRPKLVPRVPVPEALLALVEKAMAKEPADRFQTAAEMARALEGIEWPPTETPLDTAQIASGNRTLNYPLPKSDAPARPSPPPALAPTQELPPLSPVPAAPTPHPTPRRTALLAAGLGLVVVVGLLIGLKAGGPPAPVVTAPGGPSSPAPVPPSAAPTAAPTAASTAPTAPPTEPVLASAAPTEPAPPTEAAPASRPKRPHGPSSRPSPASKPTAEPEEILAPPPR